MTWSAKTKNCHKTVLVLIGWTWVQYETCWQFFELIFFYAIYPEQGCQIVHLHRSSCRPTQRRLMTSAPEPPCHRWACAHTRSSACQTLACSFYPWNTKKTVQYFALKLLQKKNTVSHVSTVTASQSTNLIITQQHMLIENTRWKCVNKHAKDTDKSNASSHFSKISWKMSLNLPS